MEFPASGTVRASGMCSLRNSRVWAPASSRVRVEAVMASSSPDRVCMAVTKSSISANCAGVAWTTRSGPSATMVRSSSVTRLAISTMTCRDGSSPVISRSIQASMGGHATGLGPGRALLVMSNDAPCAPPSTRPGVGTALLRPTRRRRGRPAGEPGRRVARPGWAGPRPHRSRRRHPGGTRRSRPAPQWTGLASRRDLSEHTRASSTPATGANSRCCW